MLRLLLELLTQVAAVVVAHNQVRVLAQQQVVQVLLL
jgi:hypothetical protein